MFASWCFTTTSYQSLILILLVSTYCPTLNNIWYIVQIDHKKSHWIFFQENIFVIWYTLYYIVTIKKKNTLIRIIKDYKRTKKKSKLIEICMDGLRWYIF